MERCDLFVGSDSVVTHLAAATGTPTIALFGPTDPRIWGPRGKKVEITRAKPLAPRAVKKKGVIARGPTV